MGNERSRRTYLGALLLGGGVVVAAVATIVAAVAVAAVAGAPSSTAPTAAGATTTSVAAAAAELGMVPLRQKRLAIHYPNKGALRAGHTLAGHNISSELVGFTDRMGLTLPRGELLRYFQAPLLGFHHISGVKGSTYVRHRDLLSCQMSVLQPPQSAMMSRHNQDI